MTASVSRERLSPLSNPLQDNGTQALIAGKSRARNWHSRAGWRRLSLAKEHLSRKKHALHVLLRCPDLRWPHEKENCVSRARRGCGAKAARGTWFAYGGLPNGDRAGLQRPTAVVAAVQQGQAARPPHLKGQDG